MGMAILEANSLTKTIDTGTHRVEILRGAVQGVVYFFRHRIKSFTAFDDIPGRGNAHFIEKRYETYRAWVNAIKTQARLGTNSTTGEPLPNEFWDMLNSLGGVEALDASAKAAPPPLPKIGELRYGYKYKGGPVDSPTSWEQVQ